MAKQPEIIVVLHSISLTKKNFGERFFFRLGNGHLPTKLSSYYKQPIYAAQKIIKTHTQLDPQWVAPKLVDAFKVCRNIILLYAAEIPHDTFLLDGEWVSITNMNNVFTDEDLTYINKVIANI